MNIVGVIKFIRYFIILLPVFLVIVAGITYLYVPFRGEKRGIKSCISKLKRNIIWGLLCCVLYIGCYLCITYIVERINCSITIGLNYAEASQGLNPNGTRFNTYDVIDDSVLERAIENGDMDGISVKQLRSTLSVVPLNAGEEISAEQYYVSTEYFLVYQATTKTILLDGKKVLKSVVDAFDEQFLNTYSRKTDVLEVEYSDVDKADYLDKVGLLEKKSTAIQNYLWKCQSQGGNYISEEGETFASLAQKIEDFQNVQMESLESYILTNGLTQDRNRQLAKLNYKNLMSDINYQKQIAEYNIRLETIDMYERDMATIVLVPTTDDTGEYYMSRTKIAVDNFADEANNYSQLASAEQLQIDNNKYAMKQIQNTNATEEVYSTVDLMIETIENTLKEYANRALNMVHDFDNKTRGDYLIFTYEQDTLKDYVIKCGVLFLVMAGAYFFAVVLFPDKKSLKKKHR